MFQDMMKDSWVYQEIVEESEEKGRSEERERGLRNQRSTVVQLVKRDFPALQVLAEQQVQNIQDSDVLQDLISQLFATTSVETARKLLLDLHKN